MIWANQDLDTVSQKSPTINDDSIGRVKGNIYQDTTCSHSYYEVGPDQFNIPRCHRIDQLVVVNLEYELVVLIEET